MEKDIRFCYKENEKMLQWIKENQEKFNVTKKEAFLPAFNDEFDLTVASYLQAKGILKKFGIENIGYVEDKEGTLNIIVDIIEYANKINEKDIINILENCNNMTELKKIRYNLIVEKNKNFSEEKFKFSDILKKTFEILKKEFENFEIIDTRKKLKTEEEYIGISLDEKDFETKTVAIISIVENGIRSTYKIFDDNNKVFSIYCGSDVNYITDISDKIDKILEENNLL